MSAEKEKGLNLRDLARNERSGAFSKKSWDALVEKATELKRRSLQKLVMEPSPEERHRSCTLETEGFYFDYSKNYVDEGFFSIMEEVLSEVKLKKKREELFSGGKLNTTEERAVLHTLLRDPLTRAQDEGGESAEILNNRERFLRFAEDVRTGRVCGANGKSFKSVVVLGIGGSSLSVEMASHALSFERSGPEIFFVSNVDLSNFLRILGCIRIEETLFLIASKTLTTQETMTNALYAKKKVIAAMGKAAVEQHFVGLSANVEGLAAFGIIAAYRFPIWDFVGGRFSLWSSIGLPLAIAIGREAFSEMLAGAHAMDKHFYERPLRENIVLILASIHFFNATFMGFSSRAVIPYSDRLSQLVRYLQQLELESNGKSVDLDGKAIAYPTVPVVWGEPGTDAEHSFFQLLHQGSAIIPVDFIGIRHMRETAGTEHDMILKSHLVAQSEALTWGWRPPKLDGETALDKLRRANQFFSGGRPTNLLCLTELSPYMLGKLNALYEHKVFVEGLLWHINSFDQWGVELGKKLSKHALSFLQGGVLATKAEQAAFSQAGKIHNSDGEALSLAAKRALHWLSGP